MEQRQKCWEGRDNIGIGFADQLTNYEKFFAPLPALVTPKVRADMVAEDLELTLRSLGIWQKGIEAAKDVLALQGQIVILNANEFLLRDNPTDADFARLLNDARRYALRYEARLVGGEEARKKVRERVEGLINIANAKFGELRRQKAVTI